MADAAVITGVPATRLRAGVRGEPTGWVPSRRPIAVAAVLFLVLSLGLWWGVWSAHPSSTTTCGCGDAARFLWFFEWPAFALGHGHNVWYSQYLFHPTGINLLNDTSVLALGIVLTPITLLFGPVASMNVALTLAPVLSALAMFMLLRRWVRWTPAVFVGALCYGFSPFLITELAYNQLNVAFLAIPPLMVIALDELVIRQRRSPYRVGVMLALLAVLQFFVGIEMLLIVAIATVVGLVLIVVFVAVRPPDCLSVRSLRLRADHAGKGLVTALVVGVALLAYPTWFFLRGPAHLSGPIWANGAVDQYGNALASFWSTAVPYGLVNDMRYFGGYQGGPLPGLGYLGAGVVVVAVVGVLLWRHDRLLLLFGALGLVSAALSLNPHTYWWAPWRLVEKVPQVGNIVEVRFSAITTLCGSVVVGVVVDRVHGWALSRWPVSHRQTEHQSAQHQSTEHQSARHQSAQHRSAGHQSARHQPAQHQSTGHQSARHWYPGALAGAAVALVALVPSVITLGPNLPLTVQAVVLPKWYEHTGSTLPPGQVILAYPAPFSGIQVSMAWQAVNRMGYAMAGGGGPQGVPAHAGAEQAGFKVLASASLGLGPAPEPTPANLAAVRKALAAWQVTMVVIPDQPNLPSYEQGRGTAYAVGLFTAVLGVRPTYQQSAWVWSSVRTAGTSIPMTQAGFAACTTGTSTDDQSHEVVPSCVLAAGR